MRTLLFSALSLILPLEVSAAPTPRLYVFDCGSLKLNSLEMFGLAEGESDVTELFVPCYLISHNRGLMLWDGGLPRSIADAEGPVVIDTGSMVYDTWIEEQLEPMGLSSADVSQAAYSHLNFDHAGAANYFLESEVLMQRTEWEAAFAGDAEFVDSHLLDGLKGATLWIEHDKALADTLKKVPEFYN